MKVLRNLIAIGLVFLVILSSGCSIKSTNGNVPSSSNLTVKMLDVGQGDAFLIKTSQQVILLDTGDIDARDLLVNKLKAEGITKIDKLIITHPHADHLGGAMGVLMNFDVKSVYDNGQITTTSTYRKYIKKVTDSKIPYKQLLAGEHLEFGDGIKFIVYSPTKRMIDTEEDLNNNSIVGKLKYGDFSILFTGDSESAIEKELLNKYKDELKSTILKSPHHGSKTSSNNAYLKAISPECVLISVGAGNDYKHPHETTLNKYKKLNFKIYRTDFDGTVTITSDGHGYNVLKEKVQ